MVMCQHSKKRLAELYSRIAVLTDLLDEHLIETKKVEKDDKLKNNLHK